MDFSKNIKANLAWFENSGVMLPADGSWGVGERIAVAGTESEKTLLYEFPAWTPHDGYLVIEQRRADCNFEAALLYLLAGRFFGEERELKIGRNLLAYLYYRSGLFNRGDRYRPEAGWNWSNIKRGTVVYFDDNAWCIALQIAIGKMEPELDQRYGMVDAAMTLVPALVAAMERTIGHANAAGEWRDPEQEWEGRLELPHWGSLATMALATAAGVRENAAARDVVRRYHRYVRESLGRMTVSEFAYAIIGACAAYRAYGDAEDLELARYAAGLIFDRADRESGNLPAEHYEAPTGPQLVDTIYTLNWSVLALQMFAGIEPDNQRVRELLTRQLALLAQIQDQTPQPAFYGCWRGMFDLETGRWGGGDCFEGGAGSIYTGWTNAPISSVMLWEMQGRSLLDALFPA